ncbi:NAD(P)H-binding protein [Asticcacaulis taihuensis]|uniref:NAD(P)H-binding protein n=1 Tax=Asticcacaulis taihuensis TaxID=260084 RepID=UPI001FE0126B|nr:NAD(P)H-binding protein [Asticcacaulis taihuensis]
MHIFVTGATGWVGSAIVAELVGAGHSVSGLVRTTDKAPSLSAAGAQVILGSVDNHGTLRESVRAADAVIHTAFNHDFSKFHDGIAQD